MDSPFPEGGIEIEGIFSKLRVTVYIASVSVKIVLIEKFKSNFEDI